MKKKSNAKMDINEAVSQRFHEDIELMNNPMRNKIVQLQGIEPNNSYATQSTPQYSSIIRQFYPTVPANTQSTIYRLGGDFDVKRLEQTHILEFLKNGRPEMSIDSLHSSGNNVSLANTLETIHSSVGCVEDDAGEIWGTCVLISANLALMPRHILEGAGNVNNYKSRFGYIKNPYSGQVQEGATYNILSIVENDLDLDYAVVALERSPGCRHRYLKLNPDDSLLGELALLHYPLKKPLQVSVHAIVETSDYIIKWFQTFHDTDYGSSGGAYIQTDGSLVAIHIGAELEEDFFNCNLMRYALSISKILEKNSSGIIARIINRQLDCSKTYNFSNYICELDFVGRPFLDVEDSFRRRKLNYDQKQAYLAGKNSTARAEQFAAQWPVASKRQLSIHFPKLGLSIFSKSIPGETTNKKIYRNMKTGWALCYDQASNYSTVSNEKGHYVDLHGNTSPNGQGAQFHFKEDRPIEAKNSKAGFFR